MASRGYSLDNFIVDMEGLVAGNASPETFLDRGSSLLGRS